MAIGASFPHLAPLMAVLTWNVAFASCAPLEPFLARSNDFFFAVGKIKKYLPFL
jgi:hypothetical protein